MKNKKGQSVAPIITLIIGVGVAVLSLILINVLGGKSYQISETSLKEIGNRTVTEDQFYSLNSTVQRLSHGSIHSSYFTCFNYTGTTREVIAIGTNYTVDYEAGTIKLDADGDVANNMTTMACNYTYGDLAMYNNVRNSIIGGFDANKSSGDLLPLIVLAVIFTVIIGGVLLGGFGKITGGNAL